MQPTVDEVVRDPEFQNLPFQERHKVLLSVDPDYAGLKPGEQSKVLNGLKQQSFWQGGQKQAQATTTQSEIRQGPSRAAYAISDIARPVLTGVGAGIGGLLGAGAGGAGGLAGGPAAPATVPTGATLGSIAGAGLGYTTGNKIADVIDTGLGVSRGVPDLKNATLSTLKDISSGAMMEMGGQVGGKLITSGLAALAKRGGLPYSTGASRVKAGNVLENVYGDMSAREASNAARVADASRRAGVHQPLTLAQQMGRTKAAAFEQSMAAKDDLMDALTRQDTSVRETALSRMRSALGRGQALPATQDVQSVGANIHGSINSALEPVKAAERVIWGEVPSYPMPNVNLQSAIKSVTSEPYEKPVQDAIDSTIAYMSKMPKNTEGMRAIDRTLTNNISKALQAGDNNLARVYQNLKAGVSADFRAISKAAETGDIALAPNGEVVIPSQLRSERDRIMALMGDSKTATHAGVRLNEINNTLRNLQPAEDVASAYTAAKNFSRQKFERFDRGATSRVMAKGNEIEGQRLPYEQIPSKFYTPSGANDLVRAIGPQRAAEQMRPFVVTDLLSKTAQNGEMSVIAAENYLKKNYGALKRLNLVGEVQGIIKGQLPNEFERLLAAKRVDRLTDNPYFTTQEASKLLRDYAPVIRKYYGNDAVQSLRDYHSLMKAMGRNKNVSYSGGSNTWEKFANTPEELAPVGRKVFNAVVNAIMYAGAGAYMGGPVGAVAGAAAGTTTKILAENARVQTARFLREAIVDPAKAKALMQIARSSNAAAANAKSMSTLLGRWITTGEGTIGGVARNLENRESEQAPQ